MTSLTGSHPSGKKRKVVSVVLLDTEEYFVYVDAKSKFQDVFNQVAAYLSLRETEYFGLAFQKDGEFQFVSSEDKIHKHAPKGWKSGSGEGFDVHGRPIITVYFRVQFYVDQVVLLREKVTRHLYYLQLKHNVLRYQHASLEEKWFLVAAYALQADYGNYTGVRDEDGDYFDPREYFPAWMVEKRGISYLVQNTPVIHRDLHNLPRSEAEWRFIKETSLPPAAHNLHFYRLKKRKADKAWNSWLGICAKGIEIYEDMEDGFKDLISTFLWPDIGKLTFDKKKFEIRAEGSPAGRKFTYYTDSDMKSKYLLTLSRNTHMFQMAIQPKLMEIRHLDAEDKRRYRESYIYSDSRDLVTNGGSFRANISPRSKTAAGGNRYSVASDASSNTTSGIASDKMTVSFEETDECTHEIMIDCPPLPGLLLNTPSPPRSKMISTLPGYKPSPLPGANRSPVLENKEQFSAYTFPSNRTSSQSPFANRATANKTQTNVNSGQSDVLFSNSGSSGRSRMQQQQQQPQSSGMYSPILPVYSASPPEVVREKTSRPASRSASRKDSFKEILAQLQVHSAELKATNVIMPQPYPVETPRLKHVPSFHMEDLDNRPASHSGSSDHRTHKSYASDASNQSSLVASCSTVTSVGSPQHIHMSHSSGASFSSSELKLQEAEEYMMPPPPLFVDERALRDIPIEPMHVQSQIVQELEVTELLQTDTPTDTSDLHVSAEEDNEGEGGQKSAKKQKPTHITVQNQKEVLHPEIEEIRGQSHNFSLPFITALCNDKSLLPHNASRPGSVSSAGDVSVHDTRRLSVNFPSSASGTMVTMPTNRPFSWHSESFDLDAQLASRSGNSPTLPDNHRSVPQNLSEFTTTSTASWTQAIAYSMPVKQNMDRYSPELIASQLMIPPKISSGRINKAESGSLQHKALMKENFGIA